MNTQIYQEASEWLIDFRTEEVDAHTRRRFEVWLSASPEHVRAYLELTSIWETTTFIDPKKHVDVDGLIARAREGHNVVSLEGPSAVPAGPTQRPRFRLAWTPFQSPVRLLVAGVLGLLAVGSIAVEYVNYRNPTYSTDVGEQRSITLSDGSTVELNARSRIRLHFTDHERAVDLVRGQALFHVSKDRSRPFTVRSEGTTVRAVGTEFDVYRKTSGTTVTVIEGTVAVLTPSPVTSAPSAPRDRFPGSAERTLRAGVASTELLVSAGEQVVVCADRVPQPGVANVAAATAWTQHRLVFDATPLRDVAEEFNRYNSRQLIIESAGLEDFHVSGAFSSTDPMPLLRFLQAQSGLRVVESNGQIVVTRN